LLWPRRPAGAARFVGCAGKQQTAIQYDIGAAQRADALGAHCQAADLYTLALRHGADTPAEHNVVWLEQHAHTSYLACPRRRPGLKRSPCALGNGPMIGRQRERLNENICVTAQFARLITWPDPR
jgi:hypothetical protein